jgi:CDP-diacylglycerol--serine O-phosphatidyltransferase
MTEKEVAVSRSWTKQLPNMVTLSNLLCGVLGIAMVIEGRPFDGFLLMILGAVMDFFDGWVARLLKADSDLGLQLDSLADVVTFGVLPGLIWRSLMQEQGYCSAGFCINNYVWVLIPLGAAYRLAKFNVDTRQLTGFMGVPTPITGLAVGSWAMIAYSYTPDAAGMGWLLSPLVDIRPWLSNFYVWLYMPLFVAFMMNSDFAMLAMKFKPGDPLRKWKIVLLIAAVPCLLFGSAMVAVFYFVYLLISILSNSKPSTQPS